MLGWLKSSTNNPYTLTITTGDNTKSICYNSYNDLKFYSTDNKCIDRCHGDDYVNEDALECFDSCQSITEAKVYYSHEKTTNINNLILVKLGYKNVLMINHILLIIFILRNV